MSIESALLVIDRCQEGSQAELKERWATKTLSGLYYLKKTSHRRPALSIGEYAVCSLFFAPISKDMPLWCVHFLICSNVMDREPGSSVWTWTVMV